MPKKLAITDTITGILSEKLYPYSKKRAVASAATSPIISARRTNVPRPGNEETRDVPRLIVFVIGGVTYSEVRTAYEVAMANKDWEVLIGSDCVLTPSSFVEKLSSLND
ncbi:syntaxin-binding protein 1 [Exaiptasia diaphana]|uniref:Uncharacterized protein n=1 Tax=Exaiptasia diaphana TaxID=2652724 RepID=A0A913YZ30_EXADI|nr:syntaxin-binding protein 1 [Exaiptasia diaphana]